MLNFDNRYFEKGKLSIEELPDLLVGSDTDVPTRHGLKRFINLDNAASTPTFKPITDSIVSFMQWYSNVHRGNGFKSQLTSWAFERSRDIISEFVGADIDQQVVIFTKNSTEAINKLSYHIHLNSDDIILTSLMEHHSNELPWRRTGRVEHVELDADNRLSKESFMEKIEQFGSRIKLVALTGASNVSGYITDIDFFARETHKIGARLLIDGAQLIPHRPIDMKPHDPEHKIDFLVFSGHKMYAPFGAGVLVGDWEVFNEGDPQNVGGGVVDIVTLEDAYWTDLPDKEEAGTPDIIGVIALGKAIQMYQALGWEAIIKHEADLTAYALEKLNKIENVKIYGDTDPANARERLGVISLNIGNLPHALTAAILSYEGGIGVRSGCFCAHLYVKALLEVSEEASALLEKQILNRDRSEIPGAIRLSFGLYNTKEEIDRVVEAIQKIAAGDYFDDYELDKEKGEYTPRKYSIDYSEYFKL